MINRVHGIAQQAVPVPNHVAIIMDGNGRWARSRHLPRTSGHRHGVQAARRIVKACAQRGVRVLTLFAFSSENWQRPRSEVTTLMNLFVAALKREVEQLTRHGIRIAFIGDRHAFSEKLERQIDSAEQRTKGNTGMRLIIAANYGGQWDITNAARRLCADVVAGRCRAQDITAERFATYLATADLPEPDLFIRTGGEQRISNFLLWQLAYTELFFTEVLWPDFAESHLDKAFGAYTKRQRRYGLTGEQVGVVDDA